jgi:poly(hydroxyalkanoate) depolymerase family esterase
MISPFTAVLERLRRAVRRQGVIRRVARRMRTLRRTPTLYAARSAGGFTELRKFGSNPGRLRMLLYVPVPPPLLAAPLIVLLHGCRQDAAGFAEQAGWTALADRIGAPLMLPVQSVRNDRWRCFNWYRPDDLQRDGGEVGSIRQMVAEASRRLRTDPARVFVAGLSAGGAMAAALLAAFPETFAAGAVVAGLPAGGAIGLGAALTRMATASPHLPAAEWQRRAQAAAPAGYAGPWPRLSIWQGDLDQIVNPANADALVAQWTALHGIDPEPTEDRQVQPEVRRRRWGGAVELWSLAAMPHGFPVDRPAADRFLPDVGVAGAEAIARFWGLLADG